ncbi:MAG: ferritin-like domain-containing protein [Polyangiaceae bacterium]|nr:ferritin-like domain-containing protein [Polyangiaceae bacterium]
MLRLPTFEAQLARQILIAAGATACLAVACGDDGEGSGGSGGSTTTTTTTTGSTTSTKSSTTATSTTSTSSTGSSTSTGMGGAGGGNEGGGGGGAGVERCWFPVLKGQDPCPPLDDAGIYYACTNDGELVSEWISGPEPGLEQCCYIVEVGPPNDPNCAVIGRPLVVEGRAARAGVARGDRGWARRATASPSGPSIVGLDAKARALLARAWADDAAYEHASVASFSKLSLELMAFGAPSELVRAAHEAALDEIRHAELGFALASAYAGEALSPTALPEAAKLSLASDLASLAAAAVKEGCVGETLAALVASAQHDVATDNAVRSALEVVRADEGRHAELAWKLVAWALRAGGE